MNHMRYPWLILVAGPYRSNTADDPIRISQNLRSMNEAGLVIFRKGHLPITGEAMALPLLEVAGSRALGDEIFEEIFHPIAHLLVDKVDAVLRIGGPSQGADEMVAIAKARGKRIFYHLDEIEAVAKEGVTDGKPY